jgi:hypothetical protein
MIKRALTLVNAMHITASVCTNDDERGLHQACPEYQYRDDVPHPYHLSKWTVSPNGFLGGWLGFPSGIPNATAPTILESAGRFSVSLSLLSSKAPIQHDPTP